MDEVRSLRYVEQEAGRRGAMHPSAACIHSIYQASIRSIHQAPTCCLGAAHHAALAACRRLTAPLSRSCSLECGHMIARGGRSRRWVRHAAEQSKGRAKQGQSKARAGRPGERRQTAGPESLRCRCLRLPAPLRPRSCVVVRVSGQWPACQSWGEERAAQGSRQRQRATRGSGLGRLQKSSCIRPAALPQVSASTQAQRAGVGHGGRERPTRVRPESK